MRPPIEHPRLPAITDCILPHEHPQQLPHNLLRSSTQYASAFIEKVVDCSLQSGQSLIEHSYKADSDLSPAGWEYAERLKEFVLERREKSLQERGINPKERRLVVRLPVHEVDFN